jgi:SSS family solute:Na+ symporter
MTRLTLDILGKTGMTDFGHLNILTGYSFLNYCAIMFIICVAMIIVISLFTKEPPSDKTDGLVFSIETMSSGISRGWTITHIALSILIALTTIIIWAHFA